MGAVASILAAGARIWAVSTGQSALQPPFIVRFTLTEPVIVNPSVALDGILAAAIAAVSSG